jgi:ATP-dependent protease ClpP protease subunit
MPVLNLNAPNNVREAFSSSTFKVFCKDSEGGNAPAELLIMDEIGKDFFGDGVGASDVVGFLSNNRGKPLNVRINSPGGLVYDGLTIYNNLLAHDADVTATIEGLAYSAASFIAMAADKIRMFEASDIGIHYAWGGGIGNKAVLRDAADWLEGIDEHLLDIFEARTGRQRDEINAWMAGNVDGTLFSAKKAVEYGFADELIQPKKSNGGRNQSANHARIVNEKKSQMLARAEFEQAKARMRIAELAESS